jgi:two-component system chemotaxis response regulator CheB
MIRLLVVDDSALMRKHLNQVFSAEGDFEIANARNGAEALVELKRFEPDVVTLDVNMPELDGISALSLIMAERPTPVVMFSSITEKGATATLEALALGAVDFIAKPGGTISLNIDAVHRELVAKVRSAANAKVRGYSRRAQPSVTGAERPLTEPPGSLRRTSSTVTSAPAAPAHRARTIEPPTPSKPSIEPGVRSRFARSPGLVLPGHLPPEVTTPYSKMRAFGVVMIGVSTGGPKALEEILPLLDRQFRWPVLVAQHMPPQFTEAFAKRLNTLCPLNVVEVNAPMEIVPGNVYLGRGGTDMVMAERLGKLIVTPRPESSEYLWHPSVEALVKSAIKFMHPIQTISVMLTGMGYDGATAMTELKKMGGRTIAESEETATVFGMPAELIKQGGAGIVLPCPSIAQQLNYWMQTGV